MFIQNSIRIRIILGEYFFPFFPTPFEILYSNKELTMRIFTIFILSSSLLTTNAFAKKHSPLENTQIDFFKCIREMAELKIEPQISIDTAVVNSSFFKKYRLNLEMLQSGVTQCRQELERLKNDNEEITLNLWKEKRHQFLENLSDAHQNREYPYDYESYYIVSNFFSPKIYSCRAAGFVLNASVVGGAGINLGLGTCRASNGHVYQGTIIELMKSLGLGAFVGVYAGTYNDLWRNPDYGDGLTAAFGVGVNGSQGPRALGVGVAFIYNDTILYSNTGFKIRKNQFQDLLKDINSKSPRYLIR